MRLITPTIANELPALGAYDQYETPDDVYMAVKLVDLCDQNTWLLAEYDRENGFAFGYVDAHGHLGWFGIDTLALQAMNIVGFAAIEVDPTWRGKRFADCIDREGRIID